MSQTTLYAPQEERHPAHFREAGRELHFRMEAAGIKCWPVNPLERAAFEHFKQKCLDTNTLPSVPEIEAFVREHKAVEAAK